MVLIGSISGSWPDVSGSGYQAAKAGLLAFARGAAFEEHARGVRFTTILPGRGRHADPRQPARAALGGAPRAHARARGRGRGLPVRGQPAAACASVPEITILPTALQAVGKTNVANPPVPTD